MDTYSNFSFAKVYTDKTAVSAIDFLKTKILQTIKYTTHLVNVQHGYEAFLKNNGSRHTIIKPRSPQSNGIVERFNHTLDEKFYQRLP